MTKKVLNRGLKPFSAIINTTFLAFSHFLNFWPKKVQKRVFFGSHLHNIFGNQGKITSLNQICMTLGCLLICFTLYYLFDLMQRKLARNKHFPWDTLQKAYTVLEQTSTTLQHLYVLRTLNTQKSYFQLFLRYFSLNSF